MVFFNLLDGSKVVKIKCYTVTGIVKQWVCMCVRYFWCQPGNLHTRTACLMWGAKGPFMLVTAMVVMVVVCSWSLGHISTVGIVHIFYRIKLIFGLNFRPGQNFKLFCF